MPGPKIKYATAFSLTIKMASIAKFRKIWEIARGKNYDDVGWLPGYPGHGLHTPNENIHLTLVDFY
jgi:hypothetical protein